MSSSLVEVVMCEIPLGQRRLLGRGCIDKLPGRADCVRKQPGRGVPGYVKVGSRSMAAHGHECRDHHPETGRYARTTLDCRFNGSTHGSPPLKVHSGRTLPVSGGPQALTYTLTKRPVLWAVRSSGLLDGVQSTRYWFIFSFANHVCAGVVPELSGLRKHGRSFYKCHLAV
jgi:hypothetical protein